MICQKQSGILLKTRENGQLDNDTQNKQLWKEGNKKRLNEKMFLILFCPLGRNY